MRPIDADIFRERLQDLAYDDWNQGIIKSFADVCNEIIEIVEEQPTVNAVPVRHGKWINGTKEMLREYGYYERSDIKFCSECKHEAYWDTDYGQQLFDYCPYCGARMVEENETSI